MKTDGKAILNRLSAGKRSDREKTSLYLSKKLYEEFKRTCGDIAASQVIEELMQEFIESVRSKNK